MATADLVLVFPARYRVEELDVLPSGIGELDRFWFPGASRDGGRDGLLVEVTPSEGKPWLGTFAFGYDSPRAITAIYSCPNENSLCVISAGLGCIVNVRNPSDWEEVRALPVLDVRAVIERKLLLFSDFTKLSAYGPQGWAWTTARLASDDLRITEVGSEYVRGFGWDA